MHRPRQGFGHLQPAFDERLVDDELGGNIRELGLFPGLDLEAHALKVPLHLVYADGKRVLQGEVLRVFGEHGLKGAMNNIGKLSFEFSALIPRGMLKPVRGSGIVAF